MVGRITSALNTRRRLGGAVLLFAGIVVAVVVLWPGGDATPKKTGKLPIRIVSVPQRGWGFAHPTSWVRNVSRDVIRLRSPDGSISMFFSSPAARPAVEAVTAGVKQTLLKQFAPAKIVHEGSEPLGKLSVPSFELRGKAKGKVVRALEMVYATPYRTYAVTVVTGEHPSGVYFREARAIIGTVRFTKPRPVAAKPK
ncbi:MAG TPA: hypothetical protein VL120_13600 [Solirubrobacteraceae bacterium]|jgi:hypothetical protein|nr:hypothetical protein [Solirubrobacteraceae bacterium]